MRIGIAGAPGSGTTTLGKRIEKEFGLKLCSGGFFFRKCAEEHGKTLEEFTEMARNDYKLDLEVDLMQSKFARDNDNIVIESRLVGWMTDNMDILIFLVAPQMVRAERIANRENIMVDDAYRRVVEREGSETTRYKEFYGIDITNINQYNLIINTEKFDAETTFEIVKSAIRGLYA